MKHIPLNEIPPAVNAAADELNIFFEKQGMPYWEFSHVADRRLVNRLETELTEVTTERDALKHSLIELEAAAEAYAADQSRASDSRCGLVQPITVEDGNRLLSALKIANEITK